MNTTQVTNYRLYVNPKRTVMVRFWSNGTVEVCTRVSSDAIWSPPVVLEEERGE